MDTTHIYRLAYQVLPFDQATEWCLEFARKQVYWSIELRCGRIAILIKKIKERHGWK